MFGFYPTPSQFDVCTDVSEGLRQSIGIVSAFPIGVASVKTVEINS